MLSSPNQDETLVDNYRKTPTAEWRNGKGQKKHITELYAIHPEATQERNIFGGDEFVMDPSAFPEDADSFVKACNILKIQCLTNTDFVATPVGEQDETEEMRAILRPRLLILSAIVSPDKFQELYEQYNTKLSQYHFVVCEKIDLGYGTIHNDVERIYNDDNHLYYVSSWKHNRTFTKFCSRLKQLIGFDVYDNVCEDVLDDSVTAEACIEKYCSSLTYDEKFRACLKSLGLTINIEPEKAEPVDTETDYYSDTTNDSANLATEEATDTLTEDPQIDSTEAVNVTNKPSVSNTDVAAMPTEEESAGTSPKSHAPAQAESQQYASDSHPQQQHTDSSIGHSTSSSTKEEVYDDLGQHNTDEDEINNDDYKEAYETLSVEADTTDKEEAGSAKRQTSCVSDSPSDEPHKDYTPERSRYTGSADKDIDYHPVGEKSYQPCNNQHPKSFTHEEIECLRSHGTPLELESLPRTDEETNLLARCSISPEQIADTNYLVQLRLYQYLTQEMHEEPVESMEEFVRNASDVATHELKDGRYIHACSAARGVMYISPSVWNKVVNDRWRICVYLDGQGKNFHFINNAEELLKLVEKDDVVIKITGKEKVAVINALYGGLLEGVNGTAYTLIRVASSTNMDAVFAHYVGAMAEAEDGNDDYDDNDY